MKSYMQFLTLLRHRNIQILCTVFLYLSCASFLPLEIHQALYTMSVCIKDLLVLILPITITFFIAGSVASFERKAPLLIFTLFLFEAISNLMSVWYSYGCGHLVVNHLPVIQKTLFDESFLPLFRIPFQKPAWWSADKGTFAGIILGLLTLLDIPSLKNFIQKGKLGAELLLTKVFSRLIPLFVLGFIAKMHQTEMIQKILTHYAPLVLSLSVFLAIYLVFLFALGKNQSLLKSIQNLLPAGTIAFSSGCSLSTIPWTIEGTAKNLKDQSLAQAIIPATTNIQQIGDCIANTFLAFMIYYQFFGQIPSLSLWIPFSLVFMLARFATAAILGGAIFIMLPIYESYLHFSGEMIAIILALNVILDPLITAANVVANGALCRVFERVWEKLNPSRESC